MNKLSFITTLLAAPCMLWRRAAVSIRPISSSRCRISGPATRAI